MIHRLQAKPFVDLGLVGRVRLHEDLAQISELIDQRADLVFRHTPSTHYRFRSGERFSPTRLRLRDPVEINPGPAESSRDGWAARYRSAM